MLLRSELFDILRTYASLAPVKRLTFPGHLGFIAVHAFFLENILLNSHFLQYPPSEQYQATFWKWVIHHLESIAASEDVEIDSRIYEHYLALLPSAEIAPGSMRSNQLCPRGPPLQKPPAPSFVTHYWVPMAINLPTSELVALDNFETVTLLESRTTIESGTTGMRTWLASFVLSEYFSSHPDVVKGSKILELGSGIGFLGIILRRLQQLVSREEIYQALWLTDVNENVLTRCQENLELSCNRILTSNIHYRFLDWSDSQDLTCIAPLNSLLTHEIDADLIVGADIIFDPSLIPALVGVLRLALQPGSKGTQKTALIAATIRNEETFSHFSQALKNERLTVTELPVSGKTYFIQDIDDNVEDVKLFRIIL